MMSNDVDYMTEALELAQLGARCGDVPIGAIVVDKSGAIIGRGYNQKELLNDPTQHAELIAIKQAAQTLGAWRLSDCTLYTTLEPCPMCAGAIVQARISRLVVGTLDPKGGGMLSKFQIGTNSELNHRVEVSYGCLENQCSEVLKVFFQKLRNEKCT